MKTFLERPECVMALMEQIVSSPEMSHRHISSVLLRKKLPVHFERMPGSAQIDVKIVLLDRLRVEASRPVRLTIAALIASLAQRLVPRDQWPELLPWLLECSRSKRVSLFFSHVHSRPHFFFHALSVFFAKWSRSFTGTRDCAPISL